MSGHLLANTIESMVIKGKGILAADESINTIGKRFASISIENIEANRLAYRRLLCSTPKLNQAISGVILFEETLTQHTEDGRSLPELLHSEEIIPGIKVDKGLQAFGTLQNEKETLGIDDLKTRLQQYKNSNVRFAKWRNVYSISSHSPSNDIITHNAETLARYAKACQQENIVPIVEPEVLMDGKHDIERCLQISTHVFQAVFKALQAHQVKLEYIILKPNMVLPGKDAPKASPELVAEKTLAALKASVPENVPSINFLSGGQTPIEATANLNAINSVSAPWYLSFSYGRALQEPCLKAWVGKQENVTLAQEALLHRSKMNGLACLGQYDESMA